MTSRQLGAITALLDQTLRHVGDAELLSRGGHGVAARRSLERAAGMLAKGAVPIPDRTVDEVIRVIASEAPIPLNIPQSLGHFPSYHAATYRLKRYLVWLVVDRTYRVPPDLGESLGLDVGKFRAGLALELQKALAVQDGAKSVSNATKGKPGRKADPQRDAKIAEEYERGLEAGEWKGQADYLRQRHKGRWDKNVPAAKTWLNSLLKRYARIR